MKNHFEIKRRWGYFCKLWPGKTSEFHVRYRFKVIPWRATGESPFEYVDVYKYIQEIRRNVWKLRMERWMMKVLTLLGLKFSSKKMSPAKSTYQVCCIPYSNKFASIWRENVSHIMRVSAAIPRGRPPGTQGHLSQLPWQIHAKAPWVGQNIGTNTPTPGATWASREQLKEDVPRLISVYKHSSSAITETEKGRLLE